MTYPVAFLHVSSNPETGAAVGGLLISDNTGIPLEFVITNAVRPTAAQRILYGKRLKSYIAIELCGRQLLQQAKTPARIIFVADQSLLDLSGITQIPVLQLTMTEQLGTAAARPTVVPPASHPEYADLIDLRSLDRDMLDGFDRIEQSRDILSKTREEYRI